jgi:DNA-binding transcriptional regulator GbsR (MarR family)|tara:strand:- start:608 stop:880 length:273 start_codon:yes stop_codon:yes gene_type:complete
MSDNTIGFIYGDQDINRDKFEIFDRFVDDSKEKITKAADNLLSLYKSDHLDDETRTTLRELEKKLRIVFKEIDDIDKKVEEIAKRERMKN